MEVVGSGPVPGVAGLVLTGGASRRMGRDKAAIVIEGMSCADRVGRRLPLMSTHTVPVPKLHALARLGHAHWPQHAAFDQVQMAAGCLTLLVFGWLRFTVPMSKSISQALSTALFATTVLDQ